MLLVLGIVLLSFLVIKPYIPSILTALVLAYISYPLYLKLKTKVKKDWLASLIISILIVILVILPFLAILNSFAGQTLTVYNSASTYLEQNDQTLSDIYSDIEGRFGVSFSLDNVFLGAIEFLGRAASTFLTSLPQKILNFFIMIFLFYYLLKDGEDIGKKIEAFLPLKKSVKKKLIKGCKELTSAVVYGSVLTALIQGTLGGIGFAIFGISSPIFWGFMMFIFAFIPFIGTTIIWAPASLFLFIKGIITSNPWFIGKGIGLFLYGFFVISLVDNFIKPKLIGAKGNLHPTVVLLGILGGLSLLGFIGILVGPIILALFLELIKIYSDDHGL